ncbi:hypothetical protein QBC46DRAFT_390685 [Diplogelasinospora grovesii]|uniref:Ankyrin repeat protein n=1 Tax=Diplogelasinospora grovesii TaxID=303347 RepID=A0AAN6N2Z3_9PEZI|nr:hypothetical protein QBC46DRAFT_390685 [Diplogelasinospora grovesii]
MTEPHKIPLTGALIARAVAAKQVDIVKFILHIYPSFSLSQALSIVNALLDNPDPAVLQVLCDHDPAFSSFSIDYHFQSFFTEACRRPPEKIVPVLHVLLDNGADLWDGFGPGAGALWAALEGGQPIEIIDKIVNKAGGEMISRRNVSLAIQLGRADVVQLLLLKNHKLIRPGALNAEKVLEDAQKTANQKIITMVQTWMLKRKVEEKRTGDAKGSTKKRWWKLWSVLNERLGHGVA